MRLKVSVESLVLVSICLADMLATLIFVLRGCASEQNPLMAACIERSPLLFVLVKIASFVPFVVAVEMYRKRNPAFARLACRCAILLYLTTFVVLTFHTNMT
jgi:hypothetical protein